MKRIKAKYFTEFDDGDFIKFVLLYIKDCLNIDSFLSYKYRRQEHQITMLVRIHGRYLKFYFDITKSDFKSVINQKLRYLV